MHPASGYSSRSSVARLAIASRAALLVTLVLLVPAAARAGEVRLGVGVGGNLFSARVVNCNVGDHVIWIWNSGSHSSTSGDSSTVTPNGEWDAGILTGVATNNTAAFSWQATTAGTHLFFCSPHAPPMAGRVIVASSGIDVADLRITEVEYNEPAGHDLVEITNLGTAAGDLGRFRFSIAGGVSVSLPPNTIPMAPNATVTIHTNEAGTNTATDVFLGALGGLNDAAGAVALYVPNTKTGTLLTDKTQIADYVEWGATGQANESTALSAGVWLAGQSAPLVAAGHSIELCLAAAPRGGTGRWFDNPTPNFGGASDNCVTPVRSVTWGRIKTLYR